MNVHEQFAEDLALYALDALAGEDRAQLEKHLAGCPACRLELEQLRGDGALLALSTLGPKPPQRAKQRLLDAVAKEPRITAKVTKTEARRSWWGALGWAAATAVIVFAAALWKENAALKQTLASASAQATQNARELEDIRRIAAPIIEPDAQVVTVVALKTQPQPQGKAFYL